MTRGNRIGLVYDQNPVQEGRWKEFHRWGAGGSRSSDGEAHIRTDPGLFRSLLEVSRRIRNGDDPAQAAKAIRTAKTHRRIPDSWAVSIAALVNTEEGGFPGTIDPALI